MASLRLKPIISGIARPDAETWFEEHDPEGVALEYEVLERTASGTE
jgi:hypothetical protein